MVTVRPRSTSLTSVRAANSTCQPSSHLAWSCLRDTARARNSESRSRRRVGGAESLLHHASGFPVGDRRLRTAHAPREVPHLLGEAVVPVLLEHGIGPALGAGRLFDGVAEAHL